MPFAPQFRHTAVEMQVDADQAVVRQYQPGTGWVEFALPREQASQVGRFLVDAFAKPRQSPEVDTAAGFEGFWAIYPKRTGKANALNSWRRRGCAHHIEQIMAHVQRMRDTEDWTKERGKYVPLAATYINQRRWDDDEADAAHGSANPMAGVL